MRGSSSACGLAARTCWQARSTARPVRGLPGLGPGQLDRETDEIHTGPRRHPDLGLERTGRPAQMNVRRSRPVERDGQLSLGPGAHPERHPIAVAARQMQVGVMVDVEVGPLAIRRRFELDVQPPPSRSARHPPSPRPGRPCSAHRAARPSTRSVNDAGPSFEIAARHDLAAILQIDDVDVIKVD